MATEGEVLQIEDATKVGKRRRGERGPGKLPTGNIQRVESLRREFGDPLRLLCEDAQLYREAARTLDLPPLARMKAAELASETLLQILPYFYGKKAAVNDDGSAAEAVTIVIAGADRGIL